MGWRQARRSLLPCALACSFLSPDAEAHFRLNASIRIVHIERLPKGVRLYMRLPTPLVYSRYLVGVASPDQAIEVPYVVSAEERGSVVHYVDTEALHADPLGYGRLVADGHRFVLDGQEIAPRVEAAVVHPIRLEPRFAELAEAKAATRAAPYAPGEAARYVGDTVTDVRFFYESDHSDGEIRFSAAVPDGFQATASIANLFLDYIGGERRITRASGLLTEPVVLNTAATTAALTFVEQGIWHILEGFDHLLFVVCLIMGASSIRALLWRVTGFTLGHTVTLIVGFLGYTPAAPWFIPSVETAIALSIVYAGMIAILETTRSSTFPITVLIGLLHGLGFAFVLSQMLNLEAPHLLVSLISFNIGVEIGQVGIVLAFWPALHLIGRRWPKAHRFAVFGLSSAAISVALYWTVQRLTVLVGALFA